MRTQRLRLDGQDAALQRDTSSEVNLGSFGETRVWMEGVSVCVMCEHVYVSACAGWGYTQLKMDPSGLAFSGQVPVDGERKGSEMMMRVGGGWPMGSSRDGAAC